MIQTMERIGAHESHVIYSLIWSCVRIQSWGVLGVKQTNKGVSLTRKFKESVQNALHTYRLSKVWPQVNHKNSMHSIGMIAATNGNVLPLRLWIARQTPNWCIEELRHHLVWYGSGQVTPKWYTECTMRMQAIQSVHLYRWPRLVDLSIENGNSLIQTHAHFLLFIPNCFQWLQVKSSRK